MKSKDCSVLCEVDERVAAGLEVYLSGYRWVLIAEFQFGIDVNG